MTEPKKETIEETFEKFKNNPLMQMAVNTVAGALVADVPILEANLADALETAAKNQMRFLEYELTREDLGEH